MIIKLFQKLYNWTIHYESWFLTSCNCAWQSYITVYPAEFPNLSSSL